MGFGACNGRASWRMRRCGAQVLQGPACGFAESCGGVQGPVRVAEHLAGKEDEIRLTVGDDGVCLLGIGDHAHGRSRNGGLGPDACGEGCLERWTDGNGCVRDLATGGAIDEVDAVRAQVAGEGDGVVNGPAAFNPIRG